MTRGFTNDPELEDDLRSDSGHVYLVLDDDPTGTQSIRDVAVLTRWQDDDLDWALASGSPAVYVETNTRSLSPDAARERLQEILQRALAASERSGIVITPVLRGDSTLRGHYPLEVEVVTEVLGRAGRPVDAVVLVPAFPAAGRITIEGTHLTVHGDQRTPVGQTEFAKDATFGYTNSHLPDWVHEKTEGAIQASDVVTVGLSELRGRSAEQLDELFTELSPGVTVTPDVETEDDLRRLARAARGARRAGREILYRVGPPFPRALIGQPPAPPLRADELPTSAPGDNGESTPTLGGLVVVGSHVALTTRQVTALTSNDSDLQVVELDVRRVAEGDCESLVHELADQVAALLVDGNVLLQTTRELVRFDDRQQSLAFSATVSDALSAVVRDVLDRQRPRFVIAKGGITSSDVALKGLQIHRAWALGSMLPGLVSLWQPVTGPAEGIGYVVFAGNVGSDDSLAEVVARFAPSSDDPDPDKMQGDNQ